MRAVAAMGKRKADQPYFEAEKGKEQKESNGQASVRDKQQAMPPVDARLEEQWQRIRQQLLARLGR